MKAIAPQPAGNAIPAVMPTALDWLDQTWPFAGTVAAAFLVAILPLLIGV